MRAQIIYATKRGGTAGLAHMLATAFEREGWQADVHDVVDRPGIGDVDAVVVGGALYLNRWPASLRKWARHHLSTLRVVPVWFFSSGPLDDSARAGAIAPTPDVAKLAREVEISGFVTFGGHLDRAAKGFIASRMAKRSAGDWRDPEHVAEWVHHICRHTAVRAQVPTQQADEPATPPVEAAAGARKPRGRTR
jgi:menaquinone-dependent protoporphyrinogen oxidase